MMKRILGRIAVMSLALVLVLGTVCMNTASAATVEVGSSTILSFNLGSLGYTYYFSTYPSSNNSSVATVTGSNCDSSGMGYIRVKGLKPGETKITCTVGSYGNMHGDYVPHFLSYTVVVKGCSSHDWDWTVVDPAGTCTEGRKKRTCSVCGEYEYFSIAPEHAYAQEGYISQNPTPTADGTYTVECTLCGKKKNSVISKELAVHLVGTIGDDTARVGSTASVKVTATGEGLKYQWYVKDRTSGAFSKSSINTPTYSVTMTQKNTGRQVYCVVSDKYGNSLKTNTAVLYSDYLIVNQPASASAYRDDAAKVSVDALGYVLFYQWYYKDPGMSAYKELAGETFESYSCVMDDANNGRKVYCVVTNLDDHTQKSNVVTLTMKPDKPVYIREQPVSVARFAGEKAGVNVVATGKGKTYKWYYKNPGSSTYALSSVTGEWYTITMDASRDGRKVYCVVSDAYGNSVKSAVATLTMRKTAKITIQPTNASANNGYTVKTKVTATGDGLKYQWYVKDKGASAFVKSSITTATYSTTMNETRNGRQVYCKVTDQYGNSVKTNTVTLNRKNKITISKQPASVSVNDNTTATVKVTATGTGLTYQWYYKNPGQSGFSKSSVTTPTYSTAMTVPKHGRQVYCKITDKYGTSVKTNTVTLSLNHPITITTQPTNKYVVYNKTAAVSVAATGMKLTYQWYYKDPGQGAFNKSSVTGKTYSVTMNGARNGRQVYCLITDVLGGTRKSNTVTLTMSNKITITAQPTSPSGRTGTRVSTTVKATGDGLTYAWYYKDAGASSFSKSSVTSATYSVVMNEERADRRVYCKITDRFGYSVTTNTVTLDQMVTPLAITAQPVNQSVARGATATVSVKAKGDGLLYTWYYKTPTGSTFSKAGSGSSYSLTMSESNHGYTVYCLISDKNGNYVKSETAGLYVRDYIRIITQPKNVSGMRVGQRVDVYVTAIGNGLDYYWECSHYAADSLDVTFNGNEMSLYAFAPDHVTIRCRLVDANGYYVYTEPYSVSISSGYY